MAGAAVAHAAGSPSPSPTSSPSSTGSPSPSSTGSPSPSPSSSPSPSPSPSSSPSPSPSRSTSPSSSPTPRPSTSPSPSPSLAAQGGVLGAAAPPGHLPPLPGGAVPAPSRNTPVSTLGHLFPPVTPSPAAFPSGRGRHGGRGRDSALTMGGAGPGPGGPDGLLFLAVAATAAIAMAASAAWLAFAGQHRKAGSTGRWFSAATRRGLTANLARKPFKLDRARRLARHARRH
jgi:hypothetical protein